MDSKAYSKFLEVYCGCYEDEVGNRPCDNGCLCDRCMGKDVQEAWEGFKVAWAAMGKGV